MVYISSFNHSGEKFHSSQYFIRLATSTTFLYNSNVITLKVNDITNISRFFDRKAPYITYCFM